MIVPMKKITLLAMAADENAILSGLRSLGVMQIEKFGAVSGTSSAINEKLAATRRVIGVLEKIQLSDSGSISAVSGSEVCKTAEENIEKLSRTEEELDSLNQRLKAISMWGDFDRALLDDLSAKGIELLLCSGSRASYEKAEKDPEITLCKLIALENGRYYFAVIGGNKDELPVINLQADDDPRKLKSRIKQLEIQKSALTGSLEKAARQLKHIREFESSQLAELEFESVREQG